MHNKNIYAKNLNLLVVFDSLARELNTSSAAQSLGLSQSAVSHALARLRVEFADDLFIRGSKGLVPTPKATELKPFVAELIDRAMWLYSPVVFKPSEFKGQLRIATTDFFEHIFLPAAFKVLGKEAPDVVLNTRSTLGTLPKTELERGEIDLAIAGFYPKLPEGFLGEKVLREKYLCIVRRGHPLVKAKLSLEKYLKLKHVLISPQGDLSGIVDLELAKKNLRRNVVAGVLSFQTPGLIVQESDLIATVPARLALHAQKYFRVECFEPPINLPEIELQMVWHERTHKSPVHVWLRNLVKRCLVVEKAGG